MKIVYFDLETTGLSPESDRIVEIALIVEKDQEIIEKWESLVNPGMSIPAEATAIHHIKNEDVTDQPTIKELGSKILSYLNDCDVYAGYNILFDVKMMMAESRRIGLPIDFHNKKIWDMQKIFFHYEPRNLAAAFKYYCDKELDGAHRAAADIEATRDIFHAQKKKYELDMNSKEALNICEVNLPLDSNGAFYMNDKEQVAFTFGKHKNKVANIQSQEIKNYLAWITSAKFPPDTKAIAKALLKGKSITKSNLNEIL